MIDNLTLFFLSAKFVIGLLIFIRITGMMASAPFFGNDGIPISVKIMISILLSITITSVYWKDQPDIDLHLWNMVFVVIKEFMVGLVFGFAANMVFYGARMAGGLIDTEMGYQTAAMFSQTAESPTLLGELNEMIAIMIFLFINGHHYLIEGIYLSIQAVPLTKFALSEATITVLMKGVVSVFIIAVKISSPMIAALFLTNLVLTLLARVAPQTNIFSLSFQLKVAIGLVVLFLSVPLMVMVTKFYLGGMQEEIYKVLLTLNPARVT